MIRRLLLGATSALAMMASANAADMGAAPGGMKDVYIPPYSWAGFYIGVNGGYAALGGEDKIFDNVQSYWNSYSDHRDFKPEGGFGGGQIGFNWQRDRLVYGLEADFQGASLDNSGRAFASSWTGHHTVAQTLDANDDWFGTVRGRLGLTVLNGQLLVYATGGFAYGGGTGNGTLTACSWGNCWSKAANNNQTDTGYTLGAGLEYAFSPAWSVKVEYQYIDFTDPKNFSFGPICEDYHVYSSNIHIDDNFNTVRVGINYHFIPEYVPLK